MSDKEFEQRILKEFPNSFTACRIRLRIAFYEFFLAMAENFKGPK